MMETLVERMARREATALALPAPWIPNEPYLPPLVMHVRRCRTCGADENTMRRRPDALPLRGWHLSPRDASISSLTILGCERLAPRSVLPIVVALSGAASGPAAFQSRAVAWTDHAGEDLPTALRHIDRSERWADDIKSLGQHDGATLTLPACTRLRRTPGCAHPAAPHFLTPHPEDSRLELLNDRYLRVRLATVDLLLNRSQP